MPALSTADRRLYLHYLIPVLLFWVGAAALYPAFRYNLMSDSISYMAIAQRYLQGDYANAINAYWSPMNIWLLAGFVKLTHLSPEPAAYILNCLSFTGFMLMSIRLAARLLKTARVLMLFGITFSLFILLNFARSLFADGLSSFFILLCVYIMAQEGFAKRVCLWIAWSFVLVLAAYSKAYALYILPLILLAWLLHLFMATRDRKVRIQGIRMVAVISGVGFLLLLPWMYLLHQKYGVWMFSSAGKINSSWGIFGHTTFSEYAAFLAPPAVKGGLTYWEDPWVNHGPLVAPLQSFSLLKGQVYRIVMNLLRWVQCVSEFSPFYLSLWLGGMVFFVRNRKRHDLLHLLIIVYTLFPLGYWLVAVQSRYLLVTAPVLMMLGFWCIETYSGPWNKAMLRLLVFIFCLSWLPGGIQEVKSMWGQGKEEAQLAVQLKQMGIKGSFLSNTFENYHTSFRLAWYTGNPFYFHLENGCNTACLLQQAERFGVRYYFYYYQGAGDDYQLYDPAHQPYKELTGGKIQGLKIFDIGGPAL